MNGFPDDLYTPEKFQEILDQIHLSKMRKKVYIQILRNQQSDFFDLELFNRLYVKNMKKTEELSEVVIKELDDKGWKTFVGYGGTALFFYDKEKPVNAW
jgi:hypothetical protein